MPNPLSHFLTKARYITNRVRGSDRIPDDRLHEFLAIEKRLDFLQDLVARVAILAHCYDAICGLTEHHQDLRKREDALPTDPAHPNSRTIPPELIEEEDRWLVEVDVFTSLIYYEVTSVVGMIRQLEVEIDPGSEIQYLVKVRDRFMSHVQLSRVTRGGYRGLGIPERGFLQRDMVALNRWSAEDLQALGEHAMELGSVPWTEQRRRNEELILSRTRNEHFTKDQMLDLMAAGVRECHLELALIQLGELLQTRVLPIIEKETDRAIGNFPWERWPE